jgi:hypothetical protein
MSLRSATTMVIESKVVSGYVDSGLRTSGDHKGSPLPYRRSLVPTGRPQSTTSMIEPNVDVGTVVVA